MAKSIQGNEYRLCYHLRKAGTTVLNLQGDSANEGGFSQPALPWVLRVGCALEGTVSRQQGAGAAPAAGNPPLDF